MSSATRTHHRGRRAPSGRYPTIVTDGREVRAAGGRVVTITDPLELVLAARQLAGDECVCWVHRDALERWGLPAVLHGRDREQHESVFGPGARAAESSSGWLTYDDAPKVHLAFPSYAGEFDDAPDARTLGVAVEAWRNAVGFAYLFSGAATIHQLISATAQVELPPAEPELDGYAASAWATPSTTWGIEPASLELLAAQRPWVRVLDRSGSYLAAWRGLTLPNGEWSHLEAQDVEPSAESQKPPGYWLVDADALPGGDGLFDPWRRLGDGPGPRWITTPLLQLATEVADGPVRVREAWVTAERSRALDTAAARLAGAREALGADPRPGAQAALRVVKDAYASATAWFEYPPRLKPLCRPAWRRTIIDRTAANLYRSLAKASPGPFAVCGIDAALFALDQPDAWPDEIRAGTALGAWKPKGPPLPMADALAAYAAGGPLDVVHLTEGKRDEPGLSRNNQTGATG